MSDNPQVQDEHLDITHTTSVTLWGFSEPNHVPTPLGVLTTTDGRLLLRTDPNRNAGFSVSHELALRAIYANLTGKDPDASIDVVHVFQDAIKAATPTPAQARRAKANNKE